MTDRDPGLVELEHRIASLVQAYAERTAKVDIDLSGPDPYVVGWAVVYEFTSTQQEQEHTAGRSVIVPDGQLVSASSGLGRFLQQSFDPGFS